MRLLAAPQKRIARYCGLLRCATIKSIRILPRFEFIPHIMILGGVNIFTLSVSPQALGRGATAETIPPQVEQLIRDAKAADNSGGNYRFAKDLTDLLLFRPTEKTYSDGFSDRLSKADLTARHSKEHWIPETVVVQAYNDMLKQIGGPSGKPPQADTSVVHQLRITLSQVSPAFSTVKAHGSTCLPSEAVHLLIQLLLHSGSPAGPCLPKQKSVTGSTQQSCSGVDVSHLMSRYSRSHSVSEQEKLFDHAATLFGI